MPDATTGPPERPPASHSSRQHLVLPVALNRLLLGYAALMLVSGWLYSALHIGSDREQTLQAEHDRLQTLASMVQTSITAMLHDGVGSAVAAARQLGPGADDGQADEAATRGTLHKMLTGGHYVRSLFLAGPERFARAGRLDDESAARPPVWFSALALQAGVDTWVGDAIVDPDNPHRRVIPVARRLEPGAHGYAWAGALLDFRQPDALSAGLQGSSTALALLSGSGKVLMFIADPAGREVAVGTDLSDSPLLQAVPDSSQSGVVQGFAPRFGEDVLFAYRRMGGYSLTIAAGESLKALLAGWRERAHTTVVVTSGASALLLLMTALLDRAVRVLRRREMQYRTLFNNATFSVVLWENNRAIAANDTALRMFGLGERGTIDGLTPWELSPPYQQDGRPSAETARERVNAALLAGASSFEWLHRRLDTGENFPAQVDVSALSTGRTTLTLSVVHDLSDRKRAEREHSESEQRYRALVDALPEAVYVHRGHEVLFANQAALKLVGADSLEQLKDKPVLSFAHDSEREQIARRVNQILESGCADPQEIRVRRLDGSVIWAELQGVRIQFAGAPAVQSVLHDITGRKAREQADAARADRTQRQSAALLRLAASTALDSPDPSNALHSVCTIAAEVLGVERAGVWLLDADMAGLRCTELYDARDGQRLLNAEIPGLEVPACLDVLRDARVIDVEDLQNDPRLRELIPARARLPPAKSLLAAAIRSGGELTGVVTFEQLDVQRAWRTDEISFAGGVADQIGQVLIAARREELLEELHVLAGELMRAQDEERRRIGRDLHDSTGQTLTALELDLARLRDSAQQLLPEERVRLAHCAQLARQCSTELRSASYLLHPPLLDELGLVSALRWLADGLRQRSAIGIRLELPQTATRWGPAEELALFRVAQEALTNVLRHAQSPWVAIRLTTDAEAIRLEVEDAGRGMGHSRARAADRAYPGVGLAGMRERVRQVGGTFKVESTAAGTLISATLRARVRPVTTAGTVA